MDIVHAEKYYKQIQERFPELTEKQIDKIVKYGLRSFYTYIRNGADLVVRTQYFGAYFGRLFKKPQLFWRYVKLKMALKYRILYKRSKKKWNGKYYFVADQDFYDKVYPKKYTKLQRKFHFDSLMIYKVYEEAMLQNEKYIFEFSYPEDLGLFYKLKDVTIPRPTCVAKKYGYRLYEPVSIDDKKHATNKNKYVQRWSKSRSTSNGNAKYGAYRQR